MRGRARGAWGVVGAAVATTLVVGGAAAPAYAGPQDGGDNGGGISWEYSEEANGYYRPPSGGGESGGGPSGPATVLVEWGSEPHGELQCPDHDPAFACESEGDEAEILGIYCSDLPGPNGLPEFPFIRYEREIEDNGEPGLWVGKQADCVEPSEDDFVPMAEISYTVDYRVFQPLGQPRLDLNPTPRGLVNLPTVVSTTYPEGLQGPAELLSLDPTRVRIPINIERPGGGLTGEIIADADYEWAFEDGGTASGRGKPYTSEVNPRDHGGYYVTNTFETTGSKDVTLTVTWTGEVTVESLEPEEIDPIEISETTQVEVVESESVLTR